jgi:hypothetical protein
MPCLYNETRFLATKTIKNAQTKHKFKPVICISRPAGLHFSFFIASEASSERDSSGTTRKMNAPKVRNGAGDGADSPTRAREAKPTKRSGSPKSFVKKKAAPDLRRELLF